MPGRTLKMPGTVRELIGHMHPDLKRKVRAVLADILVTPEAGKALKGELTGYWSVRAGAHRVIYRPDDAGSEIVAIGPRRTIDEEMAKQIARHRRNDPSGDPFQ